MSDETIEALKPCPFCGCAVGVVERGGRDELIGMRTWYHIEGKHTGIGGVCPGQVRARGSRDTAVTAWNTRTPAPVAGEGGIPEDLLRLSMARDQLTAALNLRRGGVPAGRWGWAMDHGAWLLQIAERSLAAAPQPPALAQSDAGEVEGHD